MRAGTQWRALSPVRDAWILTRLCNDIDRRLATKVRSTALGFKPHAGAP
jgi:hypothetical protein